MSGGGSRPTSARKRVLRALFNARVSIGPGGWMDARGVARTVQCHLDVAVNGLRDACMLGYAEVRELMGRPQYRITPLGAGYLKGLQAAEQMK